MSRQEDLIAKHSAAPGMRGKINAMCIACIYDPEAGTGTWRQQVEACTSRKCPLYPIRPTAQEGNSDE